MVRLLLLRHAKSSWEGTSIADHDRPLNLRGRAAAPQMGRHIADHTLLPERVICSTARRTRETFAGLLPYFSSDFDALFLRAVYDAPERGYLPLIARHGGEARTLLLIGHNPTIQATAISLIGSGNPALKSTIEDKFPTAGLAVIDFEQTAWKAVRPESGRIVAFFRPRELEIVDADQVAGSDD